MMCDFNKTFHITPEETKNRLSLLIEISRLINTVAYVQIQ